MNKIKQEYICVVKSEKLFSKTSYKEGLFDIDPQVINNIQKESEAKERAVVEDDKQYRQIVSYIICKHQNSFFLMQRAKKCSEQKLSLKLSLGIGGHLDINDINHPLKEWGLRELFEEISYTDNYTITPWKMIYDTSNIVGKVHFGIVYLMNIVSSEIFIKNEWKSGKLVSKNEVEKNYSYLESWSQLCSKELS